MVDVNRNCGHPAMTDLVGHKGVQRQFHWPRAELGRRGRSGQLAITMEIMSEPRAFGGKCADLPV